MAEWTDYGLKAVRERGFTYLSAEFADNWQDNESGAFHGPTLLGAGLTVRPVIKRLDPITLSCESGGDTLILAELADDLMKKARANMDKLKEFLKKLAEGEDINDVLQRHGASELLKRLKRFDGWLIAGMPSLPAY